jgi:hypothetical protein
MPARSMNVRGELKLRLPELLRARLEAEADRYGYSLNAVVVNRLEQTFRDDALGRVVFGSEERFAILDTIDRLALAVQMKTGKGWADEATRFQIADTVAAYLKHGAELYAVFMSGKSPDPAAARTAADAYALTLVAQMINQDVERLREAVAEAAEDDAPEEADEAKPPGAAA